MRTELPPRSTSDTVGNPHKRRGRLLPALLFGAVVVVIAAQEIPAVGAVLQRWFKPTEWQATQACIAASLALATRPEFARVIARGAVHATQTGYLVEDVTIGEMADAGGERRFSAACYTDATGKVIRADRKD